MIKLGIIGVGRIGRVQKEDVLYDWGEVVIR